MPKTFRLQTYKPRTRYVPQRAQVEGNLQQRIANYLHRNYPDTIFISDAAGIFFGKDKISLATRWKRINSAKGRPDLIILHPSRGYYGLMIELKQEGTVIYKKNGELRKQPVKRVTKSGMIVRYDHLKNQAGRLQELNQLGYLARFGIGYDKTTQLIDWYFDKPENGAMF